MGKASNYHPGNTFRHLSLGCYSIPQKMEVGKILLRYTDKVPCVHFLGTIILVTYIYIYKIYICVCIYIYICILTVSLAACRISAVYNTCIYIPGSWLNDPTCVWPSAKNWDHPSGKSDGPEILSPWRVGMIPMFHFVRALCIYIYI